MVQKRRKLLFFLVGIATLIGAIVVPGSLKLHRDVVGATQAFNEYTSALVEHQFHKAYSMGDPQFQRAVTYDQFVSVHQSLESKFGPLLSVKRGVYYVRNYENGAFVPGVATFEADLAYQTASIKFRFALRKEHGVWLTFGEQQE
ncbi:MAG TPA: hypothetical protein VMB02_04180 [Candidatus Aquilonibacter sp.]|nr:hypothetical protein [Candidatus Aquilonibacter sp.]